MIEILTVSDPKEREIICKLAELQDREDLRIIAAFSNGEVESGAVFEYSDTHGKILWLQSMEDDDITEGLVRAILNIMDLRGVESAWLDKKYAVIAKKLRFKAVEDGFTVELKNFFTCGCCKQKGAIN